MELLLIIGAIFAVVVLYFVFGIALRFLWGWWILVLAIPLCLIVGFAFGWLGAIVGIVGFVLALRATNEWQDSSAFLAVGARIDKAFNLGDT